MKYRRQTRTILKFAGEENVCFSCLGSNYISFHWERCECIRTYVHVYVYVYVVYIHVMYVMYVTLCM